MAVHGSWRITRLLLALMLIVGGLALAGATAAGAAGALVVTHTSSPATHSATSQTGSVTYTIGAGVHQVCAIAANAAGGGSASLLGCRNINVEYDPIGDVVVSQNGSSYSIYGWAFDPDVAQSIPIWIVDNGALVQARFANWSTSYIPFHPYAGFGYVSPPGQSGVHKICIYGINSGPGQNRWVDCETVTF